MTRIKPKNIEVQESWITPSYAGGWADYDATEWFGVRYYKDSLGIVHMKGLIKNVSGATKNALDVMFTLPVGYRPIHRIRFAAAGYSGHLQLDVLPNGTVCTTSSIIATEWLSFASVHFKAEQ